MIPLEERLERLMRCLARENNLFLDLIAQGRTVGEAEEVLRAYEIWVLWGLRPWMGHASTWHRAALHYNLPQSVRAGHS